MKGSNTFASNSSILDLPVKSLAIWWCFHLSAKVALPQVVTGMAWVNRLHLKKRCLDVGWLCGTFRVAFGSACHFSTTESWFVSSLGRLRDSRGKLTCGHLRPDGYRRVNISSNFFLVHRVVAFSFLGPPADASAWQVHHRDADRANNRLDNLAYVTHAENVQSSYRTNASRGKAGASTSIPVMWRNFVASNVWNTFPSIRAAARELRVSPHTISKSCRQGVQVGNHEVKFGTPRQPDLLPGEEWLPMKCPQTGHVLAGREVSSLGRIKGSTGLVTWGHKDPLGYFSHHVSSKIGKARVHRLVAYAFLGPPPSLEQCQVNHKDLDPSNNRVENLEYVTPSENMQHFHANKTLPSSNPSRKPVLGRQCGSAEWVSYPSMDSAAQRLGLHSGEVSRCARGLQKHAKFYEFRLAEPTEESLLPGEEWRPVDLEGLLQEKYARL